MAAGGWGHGFKATAPVSCSLPRLRRPLLLLASPALAGPHVLGTPGPGLPITRRNHTMAAAMMAFLWALVSNTGPVGERDGGWPQAQPCLQAPSGCGEVGACVVSVCLLLHASGWCVSQVLLSFYYLKITRSYRNGAEIHVRFTWLPLMTLLCEPAEPGKWNLSSFAENPAFGLKLVPRSKLLSALFGQHLLCTSVSFLLGGRGTSALPPRVPRSPLPPPQASKRQSLDCLVVLAEASEQGASVRSPGFCIHREQ